MAVTIKTGIVIRMHKYDEYDNLITFLFREEIITMIAKGVRKITSKNRVALQLGNVVEVEFFRARLNGKLSKVKRATLLKQPDLQKSDVAYAWVQTLKELKYVHERPAHTYEAILLVYDYFDGKHNHQAKTVITFSILFSLGIQPFLGGCVICGTYDNIEDFDLRSGGFLCEKHKHQKRDIEYLKAYRALLSDIYEYMEVSSFINKNIFNEIVEYIHHH